MYNHCDYFNHLRVFPLDSLQLLKNIQQQQKEEEDQNLYNLPLSMDRNNYRKNNIKQIQKETTKSKNNAIQCQQNIQNLRKSIQDTNKLQIPLQMLKYKDYQKQNQMIRQNRPLSRQLFQQYKKNKQNQNFIVKNIDIQTESYNSFNTKQLKNQIKQDNKVYQIKISSDLKKKSNRLINYIDIKQFQKVCRKNYQKNLYKNKIENEKNYNYTSKLNRPIIQSIQSKQIAPHIRNLIRQKMSQNLPQKLEKRSQSLASFSQNQKGQTRYQQILDQVFNSNRKNFSLPKKSNSLRVMKSNINLIKPNKDLNTQIDRVQITHSVKLNRHFSQAQIKQNHNRKVSLSIKPQIKNIIKKEQINNIRKVNTQKKSKINKNKIDFIQYKRKDCYLQQYFDKIHKRY